MNLFLIDIDGEYFGNPREPFAITLGGQKLHVLTFPEDIKNIYENMKIFAFDDVVIMFPLRLEFPVLIFL